MYTWRAAHQEEDSQHAVHRRLEQTLRRDRLPCDARTQRRREHNERGDVRWQRRPHDRAWDVPAKADTVEDATRVRIEAKGDGHTERCEQLVRLSRILNLVHLLERCGDQ